MFEKRIKQRADSHLENNEALTHAQKNNEVLIHTQKNNEALIHTLKNNEALIHTQKNNEALIHTSKNNEVLIHTQKNNEALIHTQKNNEALIHTQKNKLLSKNYYNPGKLVPLNCLACKFFTTVCSSFDLIGSVSSLCVWRCGHLLVLLLSEQKVH